MKTTNRFVRATGAPFAEEDTELVGRCLLEIAEANRVDNIRSLDARDVLDTIYTNKNHPMRHIYGNFEDVSGAAKEYWVGLTRDITRGIQVIRVSVTNVKRPVPMFCSVGQVTRAKDGTAQPRRRVLSDDMLKDDPRYTSALAEKIRLVRAAIGGLTWIIQSRKPPAEIAHLHTELLAALDKYMDSVGQAAE